MPKHLSVELKGRIIGAFEAGATPTCIAKTHTLPISTVLAVIKKWEKEGTVVPKKSTGRRPVLNKTDINIILNNVHKNNQSTLAEIAAKSPKPVSKSTIRRVLIKSDMLSHVAIKKPLSLPRHVTHRPVFDGDNQDWT